jgi:hypothetical protein
LTDDHGFDFRPKSAARRHLDEKQRAINGYSTGIVTTIGAIAGYSNGTDTQDAFVVLGAW